MELRDMLATLAADIKHKSLEYKAIEATHAYEHPRNLNAILCDGKVLGEIGIVHPTVSKNIDKKAMIVFAELDVQAFAEIEDGSIVYTEPSKFPGMEIDLSFVSETFAPIGKAIADLHCELIQDVAVADTYRDENGKSITVRMTFAHPERTLKREEVTAVTDALIAELQKQNIVLKA